MVGAGAVFLLKRTTFGRAVYAIGNRERAAYLSGIDTQRVVLVAFAISGGLSAFGGVLLAGYASKAAQAMGDAYLLPAIAAVVLGGASILGGRGNYLGTVAGVILITLLQSILSVMQMPEAGRQIIYGVGDHRHAAALRPRGQSAVAPVSSAAAAAGRRSCRSGGRRAGLQSLAQIGDQPAAGPARRAPALMHDVDRQGDFVPVGDVEPLQPACGDRIHDHVDRHVAPPNPASRKSRRVERSANRQM